MSDDPSTPPAPDPPAPSLLSGRVPHMAAVAVAALFLLGCSGDSSSAQEDTAVPSDMTTIRERADRARVKGDSAAPVDVFEVADFQCQYCAQFYRETFPAIDSLYIDTGKIRYVFITYPNANHPRAWPAIEAAFCAGAAGEFWPMHDLLFERQQEWSDAEDPFARFVDYADEVGVDTESFSACLENDRTAPMQVRDLEQISRAGISSTPFFIIDNEVSLQGAVPLDRFRTVLDSVLEASGGGGPGDGAGGGGQDGGGGSG